MRIFPAILLVLCLAFGGCSRRAASDKPVVTVSIPPQQWLVEQIAGDRVQVQSLLTPGANPETFEPTMQQLMALDGSDLYLSLGMPGFEQTTLQKVRENFPDLRIAEITGGIRPVTGTHSHAGGDRAEEDPHVWTSLKNARLMAAATLNELIALDPDGTEIYRQNFNRLDSRLKALDDSVTSVLRPLQGSSFMVWHPSLSYFARDYSLTQFSMESEGKEASPALLKAKIDQAGTAAPRVFFLQREYDSRQAASLAGELKIPTATIDVMNPDIAAQVRTITSALNAR